MRAAAIALWRVREKTVSGVKVVVKRARPKKTKSDKSALDADDKETRI